MERVYLGKFCNTIDCNDCKWLNITEDEQRRGIKKGYHVCKHYRKRLKHRTSRIKHDGFIFPCDECFKERFANYSIKVAVKNMTWEEAIKYCETHECKDCIAYNMFDCRTEYEKTMLHAPCCINLVDEDLRGS